MKAGKMKAGKMIVITALVVMMAMLSACGGGGTGKTTGNNGGSKETDTQGGADRVKLQVFHYKVEAAETWEAMGREFEQENPGISVEYDIVGGGTDWYTNLQTRFGAGMGPDIFVVDGPSMMELYKDRLVDLSDEPWVEHGFPFAIETFTNDGKVLGMPFTMSGYGLIYNKDLFEKAGITEEPRTLSELREAAEKLKAIGVTPFGNAYGEAWVLGQQQFNIGFAQQPDPAQFIAGLTDKSETFAGNPIFKDYEQFLKLTLEYGNENPMTTDYNSAISMLAGGEVAIIHQGYWIEPTTDKTNPDLNMGMFPVPINDDATQMNRLPVAASFAFVINNDSEHIDEAKTFLNWLVSSETGQHYFTEKFKYLPTFDHINMSDPGVLGKIVLEYSQADQTIPWTFSLWPNGAFQEFFGINQAFIANQYDYDTMLEKLDAVWADLSQP